MAPLGWHVPSFDEWHILINLLGGEALAGSKLRSSFSWRENGGGTNSSGFMGLPGEKRDDVRDFIEIKSYSHHWSSTEFGLNSNSAWMQPNGLKDDHVGMYYYLSKSDGLSVRCVKNLIFFPKSGYNSPESI